jgi:hypothetical protein
MEMRSMRVSGFWQTYLQSRITMPLLLQKARIGSYAVGDGRLRIVATFAGVRTFLVLT